MSSSSSTVSTGSSSSSVSTGSSSWLSTSSISQLSEKELKHMVLDGVFVTSSVICVALAFKAYFQIREIVKIKPLLIIPARGKSTMTLQKNWEKAMMAREVSRVVVATGDKKIADDCRRFGADVMMMTSKSYSDGMERCIDALPRLKNKFNVVINVEGDELIKPHIIDDIMIVHQQSPDFEGVLCMDLKMLANGGYEVKAKIRYDNLDDAQNKPSTFLNKVLGMFV